MTDNSPKAVVLRYYDLYNDGTPDSYGSERFLDLFADDAVIDLPEAAGLPARRGGKETLRERIDGAAAMFRNRHMAATELVAEDERVVARTTWAALARSLDTSGERPSLVRSFSASVVVSSGGSGSTATGPSRWRLP